MKKQYRSTLHRSYRNSNFISTYYFFCLFYIITYYGLIPLYHCNVLAYNQWYAHYSLRTLGLKFLSNFKWTKPALLWNILELFTITYYSTKWRFVWLPIDSLLADQAHSSVERAGLLGGVRLQSIPADDRYQMRGDTLKDTIQKDRKNGLIPFFVSKFKAAEMLKYFNIENYNSYS